MIRGNVRPGNAKTLTVLFTGFLVLCSFGCISVSENSSGVADITTTDTDSSGNALNDDYDFSKVMTVGVGTLRWVSYFGLATNVVCIDLGDINPASWNGKGYRTLFDRVDSAGLMSQYTGQTANPSESDYERYGIAVHDHNGFSTKNLEAIAGWGDDKPTVMIVSDSVYDGFNTEMKTGISKQNIDVVVINEVDSFTDDAFGLSDEFRQNLSVLGTVFDRIDRSNSLQNSILAMFSDIDSLVDGEKPIYDKVYIGGASLSGSKGLSWTVGSYLPFRLAGLTNAYTSNTDTTARDAGSEVMSSATPDAIFMDLSGTTKYGNDPGSMGVLKYAELKDVPIYTLLPYFWFGYNFDNAVADAYLLAYHCYDGVMTWESCQSKIYSVYEAFYPELGDGKGNTVVDNMEKYYSGAGSKLALTENSLHAVVSDKGVEFTENAPEKSGSDSNAIYALIALIAIALVVAAFLMLRRKKMQSL